MLHKCSKLVSAFGGSLCCVFVPDPGSGMPKCHVSRAILGKREKKRSKCRYRLLCQSLPQLLHPECSADICLRPTYICMNRSATLTSRKTGPGHAGPLHQQLVAEVDAVPAPTAQSMARVSAMQNIREMELLRVPSRGSSLPPPPPLTPTVSRTHLDDKGSCCRLWIEKLLFRTTCCLCCCGMQIAILARL